MGMRIDPSKRFERERSRARQEQTAANQQAQEAIARKFAAQGLGSSGAAIRTAQQVEDTGQRALERRYEDVANREETETQRLQEQEAAKAFARSEREAQQKFAAKESLAARLQQAKQHADAIGLSRQQFEATYGTRQKVRVPVYGQEGTFGRRQQHGYRDEWRYVGGTMGAQQQLAEQAANIAKQDAAIRQRELEANLATNQYTKLINAFTLGLPPDRMKAVLKAADIDIDNLGYANIGGEKILVIPPKKDPFLPDDYDPSKPGYQNAKGHTFGGL